MNYLNLLVGAYLALINSNLNGTEFNPNDWESFKSEHGKLYQSDNIETMRRLIFAHNKHIIDTFNAEESGSGFKLGLNHLADISQTEIKLRNGFKLPQEGFGLSENNLASQRFLNNILNDDTIEVPDEVDWRKVQGRVSPVRDQGNCGSCWAFASTGALEGQEQSRESYYPGLSNSSLHESGDVVELSVQNLVDCVTKDNGCEGGFMKDAFDFIKAEGGIDDEKSYPYEATTRKCRFKKEKVAFSDTGAVILPEGDEETLKQVVAKFGPVAVAIDAGLPSFQLYRKGVYYGVHCLNKPRRLNHGVLVVGYGTDPTGGDYWIVKNSWGSKWGEEGYIRMSRNKDNNCGVATLATIPTF